MHLSRVCDIWAPLKQWWVMSSFFWWWKEDEKLVSRILITITCQLEEIVFWFIPSLNYWVTLQNPEFDAFCLTFMLNEFCTRTAHQRQLCACFNNVLSVALGVDVSDNFHAYNFPCLHTLSWAWNDIISQFLLRHICYIVLFYHCGF